MTYPIAADDDDRVAALRSLRLLDSGQDDAFDRIVLLAQEAFGVPTVLISLVDKERQWFKAYVGLDVCETSRDVAFCNHTIMGTDVFEVCDASVHPEFRANELVTGPPHIRYYAGAPVMYHAWKIGTICLIDDHPREPMDEAGRLQLRRFAALVSREVHVQMVIRGSLASLASAAD